MHGFPVPEAVRKLWRRVTEFEYGLPHNIRLMLFRRRQWLSPKYCPFQTFEIADMVNKQSKTEH
jgi:hypothetical protein